jgi:hypothetical protein
LNEFSKPLSYLQDFSRLEFSLNQLCEHNISEFYTDYTCEQAAQEKAWFDKDDNPDANATSEE